MLDRAQWQAWKGRSCEVRARWKAQQAAREHGVFQKREGLTDEGGAGPEGADFQGVGLEREDPGPVLGPVAVGAKGGVHQALDQGEACSAA